MVHGLGIGNARLLGGTFCTGNDTKQRVQSLMMPGRLLWAKRLEQIVLFVL